MTNVQIRSLPSMQKFVLLCRSWIMVSNEGNFSLPTKDYPYFVEISMLRFSVSISMSKSEFRDRFRCQHGNFGYDFDLGIGLSTPTPEFRFWYQISKSTLKFQSIFCRNKSKFLFQLLFRNSIPTIEIEIPVLQHWTNVSWLPGPLQNQWAICIVIIIIYERT
jgi:hypothetical protein